MPTIGVYKMTIADLYDEYVSCCFDNDIEGIARTKSLILALPEKDKEEFTHLLLSDCKDFIERTEDSNADLYQMLADQWNKPREYILSLNLTELDIYKMFIDRIKVLTLIVLNTHVCDSCKPIYEDVVRWIENLFK